MGTQFILVQEISLFTTTSEICIKGRMQQNQLSDETNLFVNATVLNKIINQLQKQNEDLDVSGSFSCAHDHEGNRFMWLDTSGWVDCVVNWDSVLSEDKPLRIRA
jgi:hypothetical protein